MKSWAAAKLIPAQSSYERFMSLLKRSTNLWHMLSFVNDAAPSRWQASEEAHRKVIAVFSASVASIGSSLQMQECNALA